MDSPQELVKLWIVREYNLEGEPFDYVHLWTERPKRRTCGKGWGWSPPGPTHLRGWVCSMNAAEASKEFGVTPDTPLEVIVCNRSRDKVAKWGMPNGHELS